MRNVILLCAIALALQFDCIAQENVESKKEYRNTFRFNVTNPIIFGVKSIIFGYERVLKNNQSFSINVGQAAFPSLNIVNSDSVKIDDNLKEKGFHISADYRFYLSDENKYPAPRGVYVGPYFSYNWSERKNSWNVKSTDGGNPQTVESTTSFMATAIGFELGYQFVLWDRVSLDMILAGPGVGYYKLKTSLGGNLSEADKQKLYEGLNNALADKFPGYSIIVDDGEYEKEGTTSTTALGFRYMVTIGFRF